VRSIHLREAQMGMVLAADVLNAQQMLLLGKGACLSSQNLRMLKSWGIERLYVEFPGDDDPGSAKVPETVIDLEREIRSRFIGPAESTIVSELCRVAADILHERAALKE